LEGTAKEAGIISARSAVTGLYDFTYVQRGPCSASRMFNFAGFKAQPGQHQEPNARRSAHPQASGAIATKTVSTEAD